MIAFLDIEASGLGQGSWPVECGWALPWGRERDGSVLVRPLPTWTHWDTVAEQHFHRISQETLERDGLHPSEALEVIETALFACEVYVADPAEDRRWFARLGEGGRTPRLTLHDANGLLEAQAMKRRMDLRRVREDVARRFPHAHRAHADARQLAEVWRVLSR